MGESLLDENTKDDTNGTVVDVVVWSGWRNHTCTREEHGPVEPSNGRVGPSLADEPVDHWQKSKQEEEQQLVVDLALTENSLWTNGAQMTEAWKKTLPLGQV